MSLSFYGVIKIFINYVWIWYHISCVNMFLLNNGNKSFINNSSIFLVSYCLMMFMNIVLNDDRLDILMNNGLMLLVDKIFVVFYCNISVMLMNHILMNFLNNRMGIMSVDDSSILFSYTFITFELLIILHSINILHNIRIPLYIFNNLIFSSVIRWSTFWINSLKIFRTILKYTVIVGLFYRLSILKAAMCGGSDR